MTEHEKKLLQAQHRMEEAQARDRVKERKARTRRLIQEGAILEKVFPLATGMDLTKLEDVLPRLKLHELRHTVISLLLLNGYQLKEVSMFAGHSNISTTSDIYGHLPPVTQRRLSNTMGAILSQGKPQELTAK